MIAQQQEIIELDSQIKQTKQLEEQNMTNCQESELTFLMNQIIKSYNKYIKIT